MKSEDDPFEFFEGNLTNARERFRRVADLALIYAPASALNHQSYGLAMALERAAGLDLVDEITHELECERVACERRRGFTLLPPRNESK